MGLSVANRMITAELFSVLGNQFVHLTLMASLFFRQSGSFENLIVLSLIQQVPAIVLGPTTGRVIESTGPKKTLLAATLLKFFCIGGLFLNTARPLTWGMYLLFMIASLLFYISRLSITPLLIERERLTNYNAVNERVALAAGIFGPFLIGLQIQRFGGRWALVLGAGMFFCTACLVTSLPSVSQNSTEPDGVSTSFCWKGLHNAYIAPLCDPRVKIWFTLLGLIIVSAGLLNFGGPVFNKTFFQGDIAAWGGFMSAFQAGACLAAIILPTLAARLTDRALVIASFTALALAFGLLAVFQWIPLFVAAMLVFGCGFTLVTLFVKSRIQRDCPRNRLGRTMAALSAFRAAGLLAGILGGTLLVRLGGVQGLMLSGAVILLGSLYCAKRYLK